MQLVKYSHVGTVNSAEPKSKCFPSSFFCSTELRLTQWLTASHHFLSCPMMFPTACHCWIAQRDKPTAGDLSERDLKAKQGCEMKNALTCQTWINMMHIFWSQAFEEKDFFTTKAVAWWLNLRWMQPNRGHWGIASNSKYLWTPDITSHFEGVTAWFLWSAAATPMNSQCICHITVRLRRMVLDHTAKPCTQNCSADEFTQELCR